MKGPGLRLTLVLLALLVSVTGCGGSSASEDRVPLQMAPLSELPEPVQKAPAHIREAYQFAVANPEVLQKIPCYCGCGGVGHTSNYDCYVRETQPEGTVIFDSHAYG